MWGVSSVFNKLKYIALFLSLTSPALADSTIDALTAGGALTGTEAVPIFQTANPAVRTTPAAFRTYIYGSMSGDATASGTGTITFTTVNSNVGTFGSTTSCTTFTVNAKGLITAASQAACTPPFSAVTGRATLAQLPQGVANSIWINPTGSTADMQNLAVPACANDGLHALVYVNGSGLVCAAITAGGSVTSIATACAVAGGTITTTGTIRGAATDSTVTGTSYSLVDGDCGLIKRSTNAALTTITAGSPAGFTNASTWFTTIKSDGAAGITLTPSGVTIDGSGSSITIATGKSLDLYSDGANYHTLPGNGGGGVTTTGSPASGNLAAFSGASTITNGNLSGDCATSGTLATNCIDSHPGYIANNWYLPGNQGTFTVAANSPQNQISCKYGYVPQKVTIGALGVRISNVGTTNIQLAIYANSNGRPGSLLSNTASIVNTSTGVVTANLGANRQVGPGGTNGDRNVWFCTNSNDNSATYVGEGQSSGFGDFSTGSPTASDLLVTNNGDGIYGISCSGTNACGGVTPTFGTWPSSLAGTTWNVVTGGSGNQNPIVLFKVVSVP